MAEDQDWVHVMGPLITSRMILCQQYAQMMAPCLGFSKAQSQMQEMNPDREREKVVQDEGCQQCRDLHKSLGKSSFSQISHPGWDFMIICI